MHSSVTIQISLLVGEVGVVAVCVCGGGVSECVSFMNRCEEIIFLNS